MEMMKNLKKMSMVLVGLTLLSQGLFAQDVINPLDDFYAQVEVWESRGLLKDIPAIRPYPLFVIQDILNRVEASGNTADKERVQYYRANWLPEGFDLYQETAVLNRNQDFNLFETQVKHLVGLGGFIQPWASLNFHGYIYAWDKTDGIFVPRGEARPDDLVEDAAGFTVKGRTVDLRGSISSMLSFGTPDLYVTAGMHRTDYGFFYFNGAVVSAQAPYAPTLTMHWQNNWITLDYIYKSLSATNSLDDTRRYPNKHFVSHELKFKPFGDLWQFGIVETMIYGDRLDVLYFIPVSLYFFNQAIYGFSDNSLIGLSSRLRILPDLKWDLVFYLDDFSANDMMRLKLAFDQTRYKMALQTSLTWAPENPWLRMVQADYLMLTPYMYTHVFNDNGADDPWKTPQAGAGISNGALLPNFTNYTHMGRNLGPALEPNSDRVTVKSLWNLGSATDLQVWGRMIRHGNASWDRTWINNDGTIFDDGYKDKIKDGGYQFTTTPFLIQPVIEWVFIAGAEARHRLDIAPNQALVISLPVIIEKIANKDLKPGNEQLSVLTELNLKYIFRY